VYNEAFTEFLGHVPPYKGSSHAFQKNHSVMSVFHFEVRNSWLIFTKSGMSFTTLEDVPRCTEWLAKLWGRRGIGSTTREHIKIFNTKLIFSLCEYFYKL